MNPTASGQKLVLMHAVLFVSKCYCPFCMFCAFLKPVVGLEMQRSIKDKFKLEHSFFIVQNVFYTLLFIGESYLIALFFAWLPGISFSVSVLGQRKSMIVCCYLFVVIALCLLVG